MNAGTTPRDHSVCWLLPIRRDTDGTVLILCHADFEAATPIDSWLVWCPDCRAVLPGTDLPGSRGLASIDELPEEAWELTRAHELRCSSEHAAALSGVTPGLVVARVAR